MKTKLAAFILTALGALVPLRVAAQDVTVGDLVWSSTEPAPDELPKNKSRLRPEFPEEMRKASELGYVIVRRYVDATGTSRQLSATGTHVPYERAVQEAFHNWQLSPAKRGGQTVDGEFWLPVLFNPKSAAQNNPNATPRLLAVTPVVTRDRPTPSGQSPAPRWRMKRAKG